MITNHISFLKSLFGENEETHKKIFRSIKAKADAKRTMMERIADIMTMNFGSNVFLLFNVFLFAGWILVNTNQIKFINAFDPFPLFSPMVDKIEITKKSRARRSKLYYIRTKAVKDVRSKMRSSTFVAEEEVTEESK